MKRPLHNSSRSEAVINLQRLYVTAIPNEQKRPFGCNGYVTAVAVGQRERLYSGFRMFTWFYLSSKNIEFVVKGPVSNLGPRPLIHIYIYILDLPTFG